MSQLSELLKSAIDPEKSEATAYPWWFVIDGGNLAGRLMSKHDVACRVAFNIYGPFFSRDSGEGFIKLNRHDLSDKAVCWCGSAHMSHDYRELIELAKREGE